MQTERAMTYAKCTTDLELSLASAGAAGVFDQALTNGLAAIVAHEWPDQVAYNDGRVKSASALLKVIEERAAANPEQPGVRVLPDPDPPAPGRDGGTPWPWADGEELPPLDTRIDIETLRDALRATQPVRHASGTGALERRHLDALLALDDHTSLRCLSSEHADRAWQDTEEEDAHSRARAAALLMRIGDEEAIRRAEEAAKLHDSWHPKYNPGGLNLQTCPVCGYETFSADHDDEHGMGVGVGQFLVCHYERSAEKAAQEAGAQIFATRWAD